jgi:protoheme IX farnesyltransferase
LYLGAALVLGAGFLWLALRMQRDASDVLAVRMFSYSVFYLLALFAFLIADHYLAAPA